MEYFKEADAPSVAEILARADAPTLAPILEDASAETLVELLEETHDASVAANVLREADGPTAASIIQDGDDETLAELLSEAPAPLAAEALREADPEEVAKVLAEANATTVASLVEEASESTLEEVLQDDGDAALAPPSSSTTLGKERRDGWATAAAKRFYDAETAATTRAPVTLGRKAAVGLKRAEKEKTATPADPDEAWTEGSLAVSRARAVCSKPLGRAFSGRAGLDEAIARRLLEIHRDREEARRMRERRTRE
jgi:hypothetical protein